MDIDIRDLNYRELQALAKKMSLPGNLKQHLLLEVIEARRRGSETCVQKILTEQKIERARRRNEKYGGREATFRFSNIQEKRPPGRPRKHPIQGTQFQNVKLNQNSTPDLRTLLTMTPNSFHQILKQSNVGGNEGGGKQLEETTFPGFPHCNQGGPEHYSIKNYQMDQSYGVKPCHPNMSGGNRECAVKNTVIELNTFSSASDFQKDINYNSTTVEPPDGFNKPISSMANYESTNSFLCPSHDERPSFEIRNIVSKKYSEPLSVSVSHKTSSVMQYVNYPFNGHSEGNCYGGPPHPFGQYLPEPTGLFYGKGGSSGLQPICHGQWMPPDQWNQESFNQETYWRPAIQNNYQFPPIQGPTTSFSPPDSETQSATEQETEQASSEQEPANPGDCRLNSSQFNYNYNQYGLSSLTIDDQIYNQSNPLDLPQSHYNSGHGSILGASQTDSISSNTMDQYNTVGNSCVFDKNTYSLTNEFGATF